MDFSHILLHIPMHRSVLALKCMFDPRHGLKLTKMIKTVKNDLFLLSLTNGSEIQLKKVYHDDLWQMS